MKFVDLRTQYMRQRMEIDRGMAAVLEHGQFIMGPEIGQLETALAAFVGVRHAISVANGTASLEIALRALEIGPGDEVITVPFTWISSAEAIGLVGAKPVFVDVEPETFNLDPELLAVAMTPRTRAIIPVSLFGQMADYERIGITAARYGVPVIEDGAQSFGATRHGRKSCSVTIIGSTSFFPSKPLGCYGDGGALFTDDDALAERMRAIRTHGGTARHHHQYIGTNGRLDTLQAAVLLSKLACFQDEVELRRHIGARLSEELGESCVTPTIAPGNTHVYGQYTIRIRARDVVASALKKMGIPTAVYYPKCLHEQPVFEPLGYKWGSFPEAERASREVLSLPLHPYLTKEEQDLVVRGVRETVLAIQ